MARAGGTAPITAGINAAFEWLLLRLWDATVRHHFWAGHAINARALDREASTRRFAALGCEHPSASRCCYFGCRGGAGGHAATFESAAAPDRCSRRVPRARGA